ncbi:archease [Marinobacter salinus]|uniref:Archease n=1 Tax=Marinobacter salinus TaxID=1874317 RepID=A0A1D9GJ68_9GAMM|nr:archease [Marinobacter salinus]AOY87653.1 archease [Marinobacter salinus]
MSWEHFHHQADAGVRGISDTLAGAFAEAGVALTALVTEPDLVRPLVSVPVETADEDPELLLVRFLNAIVYEMAVRKLLFHHYEVSIQGSHLTATAYGEPVDIERHQPAVEVKGATATELHVGFNNGRWVAQCVVDV